MKRLLLLFFTLIVIGNTYAQLLSWTPGFITESSTPITITLDATKGNQGLNNYATTSDVYVHLGMITNLSTSSSNWRYVKFNQNFNAPNPSLQATYIGNNKWTFTITGGLRTYYGVPPGETILKIAILFRNGLGTTVQRNLDGSDMYIPVYSSELATTFTNPFKQPTFLPKAEPINKVIGNNIAMTGISNISANLKLYLNGTQVQSATNATTITANPGPVLTTSGIQTLVLEATSGIVTKYDTIKFFVAGTVNTAAIPAGLRDGINYNPNNTSATFLLYAPFKNRVCIVGELPGGSWEENTTYQMNKSPDGNYWWLTVNGLTPGTEYSFQYLIDGSLRVSDAYVEKVLDPWNDQFIDAATYPALKPYPVGLTTGIVGILQTASPAYNWNISNFNRPNKKNIVIYELLLRDFVAKHDWKTLRDTLGYLKNLGVNTIELMPVNEFEGNNSWGYNPDFYFAPDKYYGPKNDFKQFIDICHANGIAVVMDIALNHSFGLSPMVQMYWDAANNRPAANNPWFNPAAKHAFNVGYDMNHESLATRYFTSRVLEHWLVNYKIDGFRFDLSKGFTQVQTCDNNGANCDVGGWSNYDVSRVNIWKRYYDSMMLKSPNSYAILEHLSVNSEENDLSNYGFLLWGNMNNNYSQASMGYNTDWDFSYGIHTNRGWSNPHLITYAESHDEERVTYKNLNFGNVGSSYSVKSFPNYIRRMGMTSAFLFTIPGPKMLWQFGELGYDFSINYCPNGTINTNCRTDPKPIRWDYFASAERANVYNVTGNILRLRKNPSYSAMFTSSNIGYNLSGQFKWMIVNEGSARMVVIGNFGVESTSGSVTFPTAGTWYNYLVPGTITATGASQSFTLAPGEYRIYLNQAIALPVTITSFTGKNAGTNNLLKWNVNNEIDLSHYELERSANGRDFSKIATITATGSSSYGYTDNIASTNEPVFFYRIKIIERDGSFRYSAVVRLAYITRNTLVEVAPNPFIQKMNVRIESDVQEMATLVLTDLTGRQVIRKQVQLLAGNNAIAIDEAVKLTPGVYILTVITAQRTQSIKVTKGE